MRVLVAWGSKRGGTEGIARTIGAALQRAGVDAVLKPASEVRNLQEYDAAVVGGALYANRWHGDAYRLVTRNVAALRQMPVWAFSSGPLDDSADRANIPPPRQVATLLARIGAVGYATFGGRLAANAKGFPASAMAKSRAGDFRNPDRIDAWASEIALALPKARPGPAVEPPGRSLWRIMAHGVAGWAFHAVMFGVLLQIAPLYLAITLRAIAAPLIFAAISVSYFGTRGAREPLATALAFTTIVALLDAGVVDALALRSFAALTSPVETWLPLLLIFLVTLMMGLMMSIIPRRDIGPSTGLSSAIKTRS